MCAGAGMARNSNRNISVTVTVTIKGLVKLLMPISVHPSIYHIVQ